MNPRKQLLSPLLIGLFWVQAHAQATTLEAALSGGQSVEREIAGGELHSYQIALAAGQFARFRLEQRAIDAALSLTDPDGKRLAEMNLTRAGEEESLSLEVKTTGNYQVIVRTNAMATVRGSYRLDALVQANVAAADRQRLRAEALLLEGNELRKQEGKTAQQVIEKMQEALPLWRELGEPQWAAYSVSIIGTSYASLGQYEKAIESFEQELALHRAIKNRAGEGVALTSLGFSHYLLSRYEKAIDYYQQALTIYREIKDQTGVGIALNNLGQANRAMSQYEKAIEYYEQALAVRREIKDAVSEGVTLNYLGNVYRLLSRYEKAIEYYEQALEIIRQAKNRAGEASLLNSLANAYTGLEQMEKAMGYYEQALALHRERKDRASEGGTLSNLGAAYSHLGQKEKAIEYLEQALTISREVKNRAVEGSTLNNLGVAYFELSRHEQAIVYLTQALAIRREVKDRAGETTTLLYLAKTESAAGNLSAASTFVEESLKISEALRADVSSAESRTSFLATAQGHYQLYTELLMRQHLTEPTKGFAALALENSERQRARSLLDLIAESRVDLRQGIDATLLEREQTLTQQLTRKAQPLPQGASAEQVATLKREMGQLETELERARSAIRKASPRYVALTQPQPLKLSEMQQQLDENTLLLEYALGPERSYLWAVTKDSLTSYELPKAEITEKSARQVYELLQARATVKPRETVAQQRQRIAQADAQLADAAQELSNLILAPVAAQLGDQRLVIVADGALQYVPFAMLPEPRDEGGGMTDETKKPQPSSLIPHPLIVRHEIVSLPSVSALAIQRNELAGRPLAPKLLAVIADPVFDRADARLSGVPANNEPEAATRSLDDQRSIVHLTEKHLAEKTAAGSNASNTIGRKFVIPRLPYTRQEAKRLLMLAPKDATFGALDFQANRAAALNPALGQYRYVHFATHGVLDSERPGLSSLLLSMVDERGKPQDGFLRANDIYNLKLPAELVVLSACQTGLGKEIKGEGLVGLTRGFMYAGAARVMVSLWNVNDQATAELMTKFYQRMLQQGARPAAALRAAQVELWKQKQWKAPFYWAAFTLQGEWK